jgi:hypothetical protein
VTCLLLSLFLSLVLCRPEATMSADFEQARDRRRGGNP